ncbi:MAG TPA: cytochrome P450 [Stellaceae bacterium]|nr:cytochrome P450 [Stellaceae bacterium]
MTTAEDVEGRPRLALPPRPARPLSTLKLLRIARANSLAAWDQQLFDELVVERRFVWGRLFVISDPDGIRRVLQDNVDNYPRLKAIRRIFEFGAGSGMLCAEGETRRRHRRLINPTLDHRAILADLPALGELAEELARHLARLPPAQEIDIGQTLAHLITASSRHVFTTGDRDIEPMLDRMGHFPLEPSILHFLPVPRWLPYFRRYRASRAEAQRFTPMLDRLIAARQREPYDGRPDLLWRLVHAGERNGDAGLSRAELRDEAITLGATSSTTLRPLTWVWYLLATHPRVEARLQAELAEVLGGRVPTADDLPRLVYLRQVLDETMRLYPPLPVMILRRAAAADRLCGRPVPRRSMIAIMPWVLHRHRKLWQEPDRFDPARFGAAQVAARSRYAYLPFSIGPHVCVGASLAVMQMVVAVAVLAQRFRFRLVPGQAVEPTAWINLRPRGGIRMTVEPRIAALAA